MSTIAVSSALPSFVITLREGVEATLVVGIVLTYLQKAGRSQLQTWAYGGVLLGLIASVAVGWVLRAFVLTLSAGTALGTPAAKLLLEGGFELGAIGLLSWMLIWMTQQGKRLKTEIEDAVSFSLEPGQSAGWAVLGLTLVAVLREGFETVLFITARFQQGWVPVAGAIAGLLTAIGIGILIFRLGIRLNLRRFFQTMGILLLLIVAGLVVSALRHLDGAIAILGSTIPQVAALCPSATPGCTLGPQLWDASQILPDQAFPGLLLKAFFGYTQKLYLVQAAAYLGFWATIGVIYIRQAFAQLPASSAQPKAL